MICILILLCILVSINLPGSKKGDSCVSELLSNTREMHNSFDDGFEVRGVLLNILLLRYLIKINLNV